MIQLFMNGGVSQMDTFDYKPELDRRHGQPFDPGSHVEAPTSAPGNLMKSPFAFQQHGECGPLGQQRLPAIAGCVDDLAFLMALASKTNVHGPASYMMNYGFLLPGLPVPGGLAVVRPGLAERQPADVRRPARPARACRTTPRATSRRASCRVAPGHDPRRRRRRGRSPTSSRPTSARFLTADSQREGLDVLERLNRRHAAANAGRLAARVADRLLRAGRADAAQRPGGPRPGRRDRGDPRRSTASTTRTADFGRSCLLARRLLERGVRFVQVWSGAGGPTNNWDNHSDIPNELPAIAAHGRPADRRRCCATSRPAACSTTRWSSGAPSSAGCRSPRARPAATTTAAPPSPGWPARASRAAQPTARATTGPGRPPTGQTYCYDLHATILHLLGIDHTRLTFRHNGIDRRLTDVHGHVIQEVLA